MINELARELLVLVLALVFAVISFIFSKLKVTNKNNKVLKIVDTVMMLAEQTNLIGEEKKKFVMDIVKELKAGKIDNINQYIDDKIKLANVINIKRSEVNGVISEELEETIKQINLEQKQKMYNVHSDKEVRGHEGEQGGTRMLQLERENERLIEDYNKLNGAFNQLDVEHDKRGEEIVRLIKEVDRLKEIETHLAMKSNENLKLYEEIKDKYVELNDEYNRTKNLLITREQQLASRSK